MDEFVHNYCIKHGFSVKMEALLHHLGFDSSDDWQISYDGTVYHINDSKYLVFDKADHDRDLEQYKIYKQEELEPELPDWAVDCINWDKYFDGLRIEDVYENISQMLYNTDFYYIQEL